MNVELDWPVLGIFAVIVFAVCVGLSYWRRKDPELKSAVITTLVATAAYALLLNF
ncbi:hypothetical protein [Pelagibacterium montanilacus]|uniref:hypothetical protein n=1 Tax=Pelagibacterium montanilacus TaxID=2185280 RepID=UPI0013DEE951|nr:hypothetical protein [Pelagibacterium montanilacus]